jgi:pre-mRNA-splicing factor ATP-dependent RNA helicase DHX16
MLPEWVVFHELRLTSKQYMSSVTEIERKWLQELAPHYYSAKEMEEKNGGKKVKGKGRAALTDE